jgi:hypothetical protein
MRLVASLSRQLGSQLKWTDAQPGTSRLLKKSVAAQARL